MEFSAVQFFKTRALMALSLGAIAAVIALPGAAQASFYRTAGGSYLQMREMPAGPSFGQGQYRTGRTAPSGTFYNWTGIVTTTLTSTTLNPKIYQGTFTDKAMGADGILRKCNGNVKVTRTHMGVSLGVFLMDMQWTFTGGINCPHGVGSVVSSVQLQEPRPNSIGNYNAAQANLIISASPSVTWWKWRVQDSTGLNCRVSPDSATTNAQTFAFGSTIQTNSSGPNVWPGGNDIVLNPTTGLPWLRVKTTNSAYLSCYVRAHSDFIVGQSLIY
jgi:hypothetical protein